MEQSPGRTSSHTHQEPSQDGATMSEKTSGSSLQRLILTQLRNPTRLRFSLCAGLLASWYFGFSAPTNDRMASTSAKADSELKRAASARQIEELREMLVPFQARIPAHSGQNELNQYVLEHVRQSPLKLVDLRPTKIKDVGSFDNIGLRLQLEASYEDLDVFLLWIENDRRLFRIDTLKIEPVKEGTRLKVQLDLLSLAEKEKNASPEPGAKSGKTEAKK